MSAKDIFHDAVRKGLEKDSEKIAVEIKSFIGKSSISEFHTAIEQQLTFDTVNDHYQLMYVGWKNRKKYHGCVLHLDIKKVKIWIQHDGTEVGIANELVNLGVPKEDIVLAFHEPLVREHTGFAVG